MLYNNFLKNLKKCPFDNIKKAEILYSNNSAYVILAKAPYTKDHLLVVPKRHLIKISQLNKKEKKDLEYLVFFVLKKLHDKYKNVTILYREGILEEVGKSINHLHVHIIPNMKIGAYDINLEKRKIYPEKTYNQKIKKLKQELFNGKI